MSLKRLVMECQALVYRLEALVTEEPVLALLDRSLVLWEISSERYPEFVREELLDRGLLAALDTIRGVSQSRPLVFASSFACPGARR